MKRETKELVNMKDTLKHCYTEQGEVNIIYETPVLSLANSIKLDYYNATEEIIEINGDNMELTIKGPFKIDYDEDEETYIVTIANETLCLNFG